MLVQCLLFGLFVGAAVCQSGLPAVDVSALPPELQGKVDENQIKDIQNKTTALLRERCLRNGGPLAYEKAENATKQLMECVKPLVDMEVLKREIEEAKPNGMVDEVFKKYCAKKAEFRSCLREMAEATRPCLAANETGALDTFYNVTDQLAEFVCFKDGDRIALFIAEGGPECIQQKQEEAQQCANRTAGTYLDTSHISIDSIASVSVNFDEENCDKFTEVQTCVVDVLGTCPQPTTANIVESLFKFIKKSTPCARYSTSAKAKAAAAVSSGPRAGATLLMTTAMLVTARL